MHKDLTDDGRELYCGEIFPSGWMLASHIKNDHMHEDTVAECEALIKPEEDLETMVKALSKEKPEIDEEEMASCIAKKFSPTFRGRVKNFARSER